MTATAPPSGARRRRMREALGPFMSFYSGAFSRYTLRADFANFAVGNPQEMPMPEYVDVLRRHLEPKDKDWFAYKMSEAQPRATIARSLSARTGMKWDARDVAMTNGGFAAIAATLRSLLDPDDEAIFLSPPWFFYEYLTLAAGAEPVRVRLEPPAFDLDVDRIVAAITPRTRMVLVNSPHNPSGRVYDATVLRQLASALTGASDRIGHPIWILSDEPYNRIVFDGHEFRSPAEFYPHTVITYSYGKTLLAPGQRIGFLTVPPTLAEDERQALRDEVFLQQLAMGWAFPNALMQHALPDLEKLSIDVATLQRRRDRLVPALRDMGYEASMPEGTFYTMARSPMPDDMASAELLAKHRVLVLPGTVVEVPGWFRISLTSSDQMVEDGIERFAAAMSEARSQA